MPEVKVCQFVLFRQIMGGRDQQVPFLVTHVHEEDGAISGVAFSGMPQVVQWARCAQDFAHVKQGDDNRQWQPMEDEITISVEAMKALSESSRQEVQAIVEEALQSESLPETEPGPMPELEPAVESLVEV